MNFKDSPAIKRLLGVNCPIVAFWFPWYWRKTNTELLRKVAGRWLWQSESGFMRKAVLLLKTIIWPLVALTGMVVSWLIHGKDVQREVGRGRFVQLKNLIWFTFWRGFPPQEYYRHRIYLDPFPEVVEDFLSINDVSLLNLAMSAGKDSGVIDDKRRFENKGKGLGLPVIPTLCVYERGESTEVSEGFILPRVDLYFKPVEGLKGMGLERWNYDSDASKWRFGTDSKDEPELKAHFEESSIKETYLLQEAAFNHPHLEPFSVGGLITFRVMTIFGERADPEVMASYMVIPSGSAVANHGVYGGMVGQMNPETGVMNAVFRRLPKFRKLSHQPETGARIEGYQFPDWPEVKALSIEAHRCFPDILTIGWDLSFTRNGPEIVEGNTQWGSMPGFYPGKAGYVSSYMEALYKAKENGSVLGCMLR